MILKLYVQMNMQLQSSSNEGKSKKSRDRMTTLNLQQSNPILTFTSPPSKQTTPSTWHQITTTRSTAEQGKALPSFPTHRKQLVNRVANESPSLSIGTTLVDTLDELVEEGRIEPQLAMRVVSRFDKAVAEALAEKAKGRLTFKVRRKVREKASSTR